MGFCSFCRGSERNPRLRCSPPAALLARGRGRHCSGGGCLPSPAPPEADDPRLASLSDLLASVITRSRRSEWRVQSDGLPAARRPLRPEAHWSSASEGAAPIHDAEHKNTRRNRRLPTMSASGGVGDGRHPPLEQCRALRERAPQPKARSACEGSAPYPAQNLKTHDAHVVCSNPVRLWGRGGWEASPTRTMPGDARASTAAEGEERTREFRVDSRQKPGNPTTSKPSRHGRTRVTLLGSIGGGVCCRRSSD